MEQHRAGDNPYKGPVAFEAGDSLYGRDAETLELLNRLLGSRVILIHSVSGAGKTSLLQAGLIPSLTYRGFAHLPLIRVGAEPPPGYQGNRYLLSTIQSLEQDHRVAVQLSAEQIAGQSLKQYLKTRASVLDGHDGGVLIFDQFEEVLSADPTGAAHKEAFFDQLGEVFRSRAGRAGPWWAIFAIREDYLAGLEPYLYRFPAQLASRFRLELLGREAAREAILRPAEETPVQLEKAVADRLVRSLSLVRVQRSDGSWEEKEGEWIEPVLLQVVCRLLW
jgi:hypothetical protein